MFKNYILLLTVFCLGFTAIAQTDNNSNSEGSSKSQLNNKNYWLIVGLGQLSEVDYETVDGILEFPEKGIDLYFSRKRPGRVIERGLSFGWQPIGTTSSEQYFEDPVTGELDNDSITGFLRASNQMIHLYYTPRVTVFKYNKISLYAEGIAGMKGNALTYRLYDGDQDDNGQLVKKGVHELKMTWNAGYSAGARINFHENFALDLRYARVRSGKLHKIDDFSILNDEVELSDWDAPIGYFRIGLNYIY